jgi:hypothetical protein
MYALSTLKYVPGETPNGFGDDWAFCYAYELELKYEAFVSYPVLVISSTYIAFGFWSGDRYVIAHVGMRRPEPWRIGKKHLILSQSCNLWYRRMFLWPWRCSNLRKHALHKLWLFGIILSISLCHHIDDPWFRPILLYLSLPSGPGALGYCVILALYVSSQLVYGIAFEAERFLLKKGLFQYIWSTNIRCRWVPCCHRIIACLNKNKTSI